MGEDEKKSVSSTIFTASAEEIERRKVEINRDIPQGWLAAELASCEYPVEPLGGEVALELDKVSGGVLVRGKVFARLRLECGICLAKSAVELRPDVSCFMQQRPSEPLVGEEDELTPEDLEREWYEGDRIVLDSLVRDAIMLELPMNPRCSTDCPGLEEYRPTESTEKIDPRLAPLAGIKLSKE